MANITNSVDPLGQLSPADYAYYVGDEATTAKMYGGLDANGHLLPVHTPTGEINPDWVAFTQRLQHGGQAMAQQQSSQHSSGFGGLLGLGLAGAGLYFGMPGLSSLFEGAGAAGAAGGAMDMGVGLGDWAGSLGASAAGATGAVTGGNVAFDITDPSTWNSFDTGGMPDYTSPSMMSPNADEFGNFDMGAGPTGMDPAGAKAALEASQPGLWDKLMQQVGNNPLQAAKIAGQLLSTGLGVFGANKQTNALQNLSSQFAGYGAPYRAMLAQSYADPNGFLANSPDIQASVNQGTQSLARALSVQGNPAQSGAALQQLQNYATQGLYGQLGQQRDRLAGYGGLTAYNAAAPAAATNAVTSQAGPLNAIGAGINQITNPAKTPYQTMQEFFNMPGVA